MATINAVNNIITNGTQTLTMTGGNVAFGAAVTTTGVVTLAGALTTVGAYATTLTTTGTTTLTLPTSGTLATTSQIGNLPFAANTGTTPVSMAVNNRYAAKGSAQLVYTLPASSTAGDVVKLIGAGANGWQIAQNSGDQIFIGSVSTTIGVSGSVTSTNGYDNVELTSMGSGVWVDSAGYVGNLTVA